MRCQYSGLWLGCCSCLAVSLCIFVGCSPEYHKDDADKEVYEIIDNKWDNNFGQKVNYIVNDAEPGPNDIQPEKVIPDSGILNLAQAVALATAQKSTNIESSQEICRVVLPKNTFVSLPRKIEKRSKNVAIDIS